MYAFLMFVHVTVCVLLVLVVLLQAGRGAGLAVFGGGGDSLFTTPTSTSFMKKLTSALAIAFGVTSLLLTLLSSRSGMNSVTRNVYIPPAPPPAASAPQQPAPSGPQSQPAPAAPQAGAPKGK